MKAKKGRPLKRKEQAAELIRCRVSTGFKKAIMIALKHEKKLKGAKITLSDMIHSSLTAQYLSK